MRNVVGLSGGKDSTALALALKEIEPDTDWEYICTPTGDELPEMKAFWRHLESLLGKPLIYLRNPKSQTLNDLIDITGMLPNFRMRWCTRMLKIEPTIAWCITNSPVLMHVGLRADEDEREGIYGPYVNSRFPFREWGWSLSDVLSYLDSKGVCVPKRTDCARCYHQRIGEWRDLWEFNPAIFWHASGQEDATGHTFRSPGRDTWPTKLSDLAIDFERGRPIRTNKNHESLCRVCSL